MERSSGTGGVIEGGLVGMASETSAWVLRMSHKGKTKEPLESR